MPEKNYYEQLFSIKDKIVLVTGASRGIGFEISSSFHNAGAIVTGVGRTKNIQINDQFNYETIDVRDKENFDVLCNKLKKEYKKIDVLINCVGISISPSTKEFEKEYFQNIIETNLISVYNCCMSMASCSSDKGSIINISSIASYFGFPNNPAYVAPKGGLSSLTRALAYDFSNKNIRVNNIVPGYIHTSMTDESFNDKNAKYEREKHMLIRRWGNVKDLVGGAIYLASDASNYITGSDIVIDGGWSIKGL